MDVPDDALMFDFPITYNEVPQLQLHSVIEDYTQAWHGSLPQGLRHDGISPYTIPDTSYTSVGVSSAHGLETHFVSNPYPSVPYSDCWSVNGGDHIAPGPGGQHDSPFAMFVHPTIPRTARVFHAVPDAQLPSATAFATLTPPSEASSAPVVQGMFGATGQDMSLDTTTPSIHPYPMAMPLPAPVSGTGTPASPLSDSEPVSYTTSPPGVRCMVDNCGQDVAVDKTVLRQHLTAAHGYPAPYRSHNVLCRWLGCICTRPSTCRNLGLPSGHGVHIQDIVEHVWSAHLNFQDVCDKCGDARWAPGFSFQRHTSGCVGRKPARCKRCRQIFRSTVALAGHVELGQCVGEADE
jgi:hypothetical protein